MKSDRGITLVSLILYVVAMVIVVGIVSTLTGYFYKNVDTLQDRNEGAKQYTAFNSYFTGDINEKGNSFIVDLSDSTKIVFENGNQYTFINGNIYFNKIKICKDITSCEFQYDKPNNIVTVNMVIGEKSYNNEYTFKKDI